VATAQEQPRLREDQRATWSLATLQRRLRRDGLTRLGATTIRRVLQDAGSSYQRTRTWCPTGTALRTRKERVVTVRDPQTEKKALIDLAYRLGEQGGVPVWRQDEAGPCQTVPCPGAAGVPAGQPLRQPHEYVRRGTAKLLTLFRPATGEVRARGVTSSATAVLHPWLHAELEQILATLPRRAEGLGSGLCWLVRVSVHRAAGSDRLTPRADRHDAALCWPLRPSVPRTPVHAASQDMIAAASFVRRTPQRSPAREAGG